MEEASDGIEVAGFYFISNFDSANLARVELVAKKPVPPLPVKIAKKPLGVPGPPRVITKPVKSAIVDLPDFEFNVWTNPDCCGTEFENANRTWFYFGVRGGPPFSLVKLNIVDLNKQGRMYREGMAPVYKVCPGRPWERIRDKPVYTVEDNVFTLSFKFRTQESPKAIMYFAFTYPFSYTELQTYLSSVDAKLCKIESQVPKCDIRYNKGLKLANDVDDAIYYHREPVSYSLEGRRIDLITISSNHNITSEREPRLNNLFPDEEVPRCFKFRDKKVIFVSARVHPGETPSSFVLNGLLNLLVSREDPVGLLLRRQFVFKMIPMLNPDGVARGHYRTDTRGANLNRFYLWPVFHHHPSIYAARSLIRYYHFGEEIAEDLPEKADASNHSNLSDYITGPLSSSTESLPLQDLSIKSSRSSLSSESQPITTDLSAVTEDESDKNASQSPEPTPMESGLFLYIDMHGHASKKGIFIYGNHFERTEDGIDCMLFPKIMSINSQNFHFGSCNFTERNMYLRDKRDGTSREGCGRVAVLRLTGTVRSYTLECNYNTGRVVNTLPQCARELPGKTFPNLLAPPKYTPSVYEEIGRTVGFSLLDLTNTNPWSRIPNSEFHTTAGIREWLRLKSMSESFAYQRNVAGAARAKRPSQVVMSLRPSRIAGVKNAVTNRLPVAPVAPQDSSTSLVSEWENSPSKEVQPPSPPVQAKRPGPLRSLCAKNLRATEKTAKFRMLHKNMEDVEPEKKLSVNTVSIGLNCPDVSTKIRATVSGESCVFKQNPKRLKTSKDDADALKVKKREWKKEATGEDQHDGTTYSKPTKPVGSPVPHISGNAEPHIPPTTKKRVAKSRTQLTPAKFKKSLEKRRNSDTTRKKTKIIFKKTSKLGISSADSKTDRKRRKNLVEH